jgi:hypothetical protein
LRLFEHPDFEQAILQAAEHFRERKLRPAIIERPNVECFGTETILHGRTHRRDSLRYEDCYDVEHNFEVFVAVRRNDGNAGIQDSSERRCHDA